MNYTQEMNLVSKSGYCMACDIGRQRYAQPQLFTEFLQLGIDKMRGVLVLLAGILLHIPDDRQQVGRAGGVVFLDNLLHRLLPLDEQLLPGLLPAVGQHPVLQVLLFQVGHIHK